MINLYFPRNTWNNIVERRRKWLKLKKYIITKLKQNKAEDVL